MILGLFESRDSGEFSGVKIFKSRHKNILFGTFLEFFVIKIWVYLYATDNICLFLNLKNKHSDSTLYAL